MSFQAYLDNIKAKTGKTPQDFKKLATEKGLLKEGVKAGEFVAWLKGNFNLGHGHAMAIYASIKGRKENKLSLDESISQHFKGTKSDWHSLFDSLMKFVNEFGDDLSISPTKNYLSILRGTRKMAIVQISTSRIDVGIKLKGVPPTSRFEKAGSWNTMMTHRVRITDKKQLNNELKNWLRSAYEQNGNSIQRL